MSSVGILFYALETLAALAVIGMLFARNVFYGALLLLMCLLCVAGLYVLAFAEFVAVSQILVYAGGIMVVIIFGIMLTAKMAGKPLVVTHGNVWSGLLAGIATLTALIYFFSKNIFIASGTPTYDRQSLRKIGVNLMSEYVLPFELAGILLLITLVGAAVVISFVKSKNT
ncbi:MAG: NADH-quinone oxidoreductase subunit J [Bacteroidota bacterium]